MHASQRVRVEQRARIRAEEEHSNRRDADNGDLSGRRIDAITRVKRLCNARETDRVG